MEISRIQRERYKYSMGVLQPCSATVGASTITTDAERSLISHSTELATQIPEQWKNDPIILRNMATANPSTIEIRLPEHIASQGVITIDVEHPDEPQQSAVRINIIAEEGASARLVINHHSAHPESVVNSLTTIRTACCASIELAEVTTSRATMHLTTLVEQAANSSVNITTLDIDNRSVRRNQIVNLAQSGANVSLAGLYLSGADQQADNYISIRHTAPHCQSNQLYKGVVGESSTATFTGEVYVAPHAQRTEALQQNHNILLGDNSRINSRPQLEIYADDVKCNHGATTGRTDPEAIYYMRQRGIPEQVARRLMLEGFAAQVIQQCPIDDIHHAVSERVSHRLNTL